jgi:hypothetical protein
MLFTNFAFIIFKKFNDTILLKSLLKFLELVEVLA